MSGCRSSTTSPRLRGLSQAIFFEWSRSVDASNHFVLVEAFADDAGEAHVTSEHFKTTMAWMPEVIARKPEIINVHVPLDGWGEKPTLTFGDHGRSLGPSAGCTNEPSGQRRSRQ